MSEQPEGLQQNLVANEHQNEPVIAQQYQVSQEDPRNQDPFKQQDPFQQQNNNFHQQNPYQPDSYQQPNVYQPHQPQTIDIQQQQQQQMRHQSDQHYGSEYRQSAHLSDDVVPVINQSSISSITNIDQWIRIIPCILIGLITLIISSVFLANCSLSQVNVYVSSSIILLVMPILIFYIQIESKWMNFLAGIISTFYMVSLSVYTSQQEVNNFDDQNFYNSFCTDTDGKVHDGISYGTICFFGLTMCLLHTINLASYFATMWKLSKHPIKEKLEYYIIELI